MKVLKQKFLDKDARYPNTYKDFMLRLTRIGDVSKSDGTEKEKSERGKAFGSVYECFMYATMIGLKAQYSLPFDERTTDGSKFLQTKFWKPEPIVDYIFMSMLALADYPFAEFESLSESEAENIALELTKSMEFYAKGGLELMATKSTETPHYFENAGNIVSFLQTIQPMAAD